MKTIRTIIIAKAPLAGFAKTRLIPALGADGAARLATQMLHHTVNTAFEANMDATIGAVELCASPAPHDRVWRQYNLPANLQWSAQGEGDLGERMARVASRVVSAGESVVLIGTDCPAIDTAVLRQVAEALIDNDACMIPTFDGGYALLGLNRFDASLFTNIAWSTETVANTTIERVHKLNWKCKLFPKLHDIDETADLVYLPADWQNQDISN